MTRLLDNRSFWMMWIGCALAVVAWYGCVKWLPIAAFNRLPDPVTVVIE